MKSWTKTTILATGVILALTACSPREKVIEKDGAQTLTINAKSDMSADALADAAEQLVSPYTFMLADSVASMALQKDPNNVKAQFYKNLLKQVMVFKGIATRIRPYIQKHGNIADLDKNIRNFPNSPLRKFLLDGKEDISSVTQIQDLVADYGRAVNDFRKFLRAKTDIELTLHMNPYVFESQLKQDMAKDCVVTDQDGDGSMTVECNLRHVATRKVNYADALAMSQFEAGTVLYTALYTSYSLQGLEGVLKKLEQNPEMTDRERTALLVGTQGLGRLRQDQTLSMALSLGADFSAAAKWALQYQDRLCPQGIGAENQRKGFLFNNGLCVGDRSEAERALAQLDQALAGAIPATMTDAQGRERETQVDYLAVSRKPVQDLRSLAPNRFNKCGQATGLTDKTLGGIFVDGDAEQFVLESPVNCY